MYVSRFVCMHIHALCVAWCSWRSEEVVGSPQTGVLDCLCITIGMLGTKPQSSAGAASDLHY